MLWTNVVDLGAEEDSSAVVAALPVEGSTGAEYHCTYLAAMWIGGAKGSGPAQALAPPSAGVEGVATVPNPPAGGWTVDFSEWIPSGKGWWRTGEGRRCEPLTIRDSYSRYVLETRAMESTSGQAVRRVFETAFERYGLPRAIRSDNGSPFACTRAPAGLTRLSAWWKALGIRLDPDLASGSS